MSASALVSFVKSNWFELTVLPDASSTFATTFTFPSSKEEIFVAGILHVPFTGSFVAIVTTSGDIPSLNTISTLVISSSIPVNITSTSPCSSKLTTKSSGFIFKSKFGSLSAVVSFTKVCSCSVSIPFSVTTALTVISPSSKEEISVAGILHTPSSPFIAVWCIASVSGLLSSIVTSADVASGFTFFKAITKVSTSCALI